MTKSCDFEFNELNTSEMEAFRQIRKSNRRNEDNRDSYIYHFLFPEGNLEKEVVIDETLISEEMLPIIKKVNERLR